MLQQAVPHSIERRVWPALLVAVSAIATLGFACVTPFPALALAAAYALPRRAALGTVAGIWLANQAVGFGLMSYPWDATTIAWGVAIAVAALLATDAAIRPLRGAMNALAAPVVAFAAAFATYEAILYLVTFALGGGEAFSVAIVSQFALLNAGWAAGLILAWELLRRVGAMVSSPLPAPRGR